LKDNNTLGSGLKKMMKKGKQKGYKKGLAIRSRFKTVTPFLHVFFFAYFLLTYFFLREFFLKKVRQKMAG